MDRAWGKQTQPGTLLAWAYGLAPVLLFVATAFGQPTYLGFLTRAYSIPILAVQIAIALVVFRVGFHIRDFARLPSVLLIGLFALSLLTAAVAPDRTMGAVRTIIWSIQIVFALAVADLSRRRQIDPDQIRIAVSTGFVVVFALLIAFVVTTEQTYEQRVSLLPGFGNIRWFGEYAAGIVGLCAFGFLRKDRLALITAISAFALIFWTGTRGAIVAIALGYLFSALLFAQFRSLQALSLFATSAAVGFLVALGLNEVAAIKGSGPDRLASLDSSGRFTAWRETIEAIQMRPWFGWGDGQFRYLLGHVYNVGHPHNSVLQVFLAWGIVGAMLCLALAAWAAPRFLRARGEHLAPFKCSALILLVYSMTDGTLYLVQPLSLFVLCVTIVVAGEWLEQAPDLTTAAPNANDPTPETNSG